MQRMCPAAAAAGDCGETRANYESNFLSPSDDDLFGVKECWKAIQGWAKEWSRGCVISRPATRGSQEAVFTQPRDHSFAQPCIPYLFISSCRAESLLLTKSLDLAFSKSSILGIASVANFDFQI